jgi:hypothetical protein
LDLQFEAVGFKGKKTLKGALKMELFWTSAEVGYMVILSITMLVMLYAMAMMSRSLRLLEYKVSMMENEMEVINQEFKLIANRDKIDIEKVKPAGGEEGE